MARRGRECVAPGCERRAEPGTVVCIDHRWTALGSETEREVRLMTQRLTAMGRLETAEARQETARAFRQQVVRGEYAAVFSSKFEKMLEESGKEHDLTGEIGMLRIAMRRVLTEEEEPAKMAHGLAKLSGALGRAIVLQELRERTQGEDQEESLADLLNQILIDLEKESQVFRKPWTVDVVNPPSKLVEEMRREGILPGTALAVSWVEGWKMRMTEEKAGKGHLEAQRMLEQGALVGGELGDGGGWE